MKFRVLFVPVLLMGCVSTEQVDYAYKANTTNSQKSSDFLDCQVFAAKEVPVSQQIGTTPVYRTPTYVTPMSTSCYGYSCTTTGGQIMGGQVYGGEVYSYDANASLRKDVQRQCMMRKGYNISVAQTCTASQVPKGLTAAMSDKIKAPEGTYCVAQISERVGVPVKIE